MKWPSINTGSGQHFSPIAGGRAKLLRHLPGKFMPTVRRVIKAA